MAAAALDETEAAHAGGGWSGLWAVERTVGSAREHFEGGRGFVWVSFHKGCVQASSSIRIVSSLRSDLRPALLCDLCVCVREILVEDLLQIFCNPAGDCEVAFGSKRNHFVFNKISVFNYNYMGRQQIGFNCCCAIP